MIELVDKRYDNIRLVFHEAEHKYNDTMGNDYISTTTILHRYAPKFDANYWARRKSKELGISEKKLKEQWATITKEACERGTNTHNGLEDGIKGASQFQNAIQYLNKDIGDSMITIADIPTNIANYKRLDINTFIEATNNKYPDIYSVFKKYSDLGYYIYAEIGMFMIDVLISGTIDVLLIHDSGNKHVIGDWKTNRGGLQFKSGYYKKDKTVKPHQLTNEWIDKDESLLPPINNLPNCNGSIYNLQLSMYAYGVEQILGIPNAGMWLCHIDSDFELNDYGMPRRFSDGLYHIKDNPIEKTTFYRMPYRKNEILRIIEDRKKELTANGINKQFSLGL